MTVPVLIYNLKIDRLTPDTGTTQAIFYVNNTLQTVFPFSLGSNSLYQVSIQTYITGSLQVVEYSFVGQIGTTNHPTLQMVLNSGNSSTGKNLDLTNGTLLATLVQTDSLISNTAPFIDVISDLFMNSTQAIDFEGEVLIEKLGTKVIDTSGNTLTIASSNIVINGTTNTINGITTFTSNVNMSNGKTLNFVSDIGIKRNGTTFIETTDANYINMNKPLRLYNMSSLSSTDMLYYNPTTNIVSYKPLPTTIANLSGGATGSIPYQSSASTTSFLPIGSNTQVLIVSGGLPSWGSPITSVAFTNMLTLGGNNPSSNGVAYNATVAGINTIQRILTATVKHTQNSLCGTTLDTANNRFNINTNGTYKIEVNLNVRTSTAAYDVNTLVRLNGSTTSGGFTIAQAGMTAGSPWYASARLMTQLVLVNGDQLDFISQGIGGTFNATLLNGSSICITRIE
jgi:hypothetical protein